MRAHLAYSIVIYFICYIFIRLVECIFISLVNIISIIKYLIVISLLNYLLFIYLDTNASPIGISWGPQVELTSWIHRKVELEGCLRYGTIQATGASQLEVSLNLLWAIIAMHYGAIIFPTRLNASVVHI